MPLRTPDLNFLIQEALRQPGPSVQAKKLALINAAQDWWATTYPGVRNVINEKLYQFLLSSYTPPTSDYADVVLADLPASYWRFNEAAGLVATDATGHNHGAYTADVATFTPRSPSPVGSGLALGCDGTADRRMIVPPSAIYDGIATGNYAIELWLKLAVANGSNQLALDLRAATGFSILGIVRVVTDHVQFHRRNADSSAQIILDCPAVLDNAWHHYVFTKIGPSFFAYIDGAIFNTQPSVVGSFDPAESICVGGNGLGASNYINGMVDEVALYAHGLSGAQVLNHFNAA